MLRSLLARVRLIRDPDQLGLAFDRGAEAHARLGRLGLHGIDRVVLTRNRSVYVSIRGRDLRMHESFVDAPDDVLRAVVIFACGRGVERHVARRLILAYPIARAPRTERRRERMHPDDRAMAERLSREHARLNQERFGGQLAAMQVRVSRRLRTRLGHYAPAASHGAPEIVIGRRHVRRHGWDEALDTLLHEMVHQWQEENGLSVDHGPAFRRKAREVGVMPRAKRSVDSRE